MKAQFFLSLWVISLLTLKHLSSTGTGRSDATDGTDLARISILEITRKLQNDSGSHRCLIKIPYTLKA